jgi:hypothetical protein
VLENEIQALEPGTWPMLSRKTWMAKPMCVRNILVVARNEE